MNQVKLWRNIKVIDRIKKWYNTLTLIQKLWIAGSTLAIMLLGIISGDSWVNILIGTIGMFYVSVYASSARGAFLLGVVYVGLYTVICLKNRIMLDALQNIVLIPIYIASFIHWGKRNIKPRNGTIKQNGLFVIITIVAGISFYFVSKALHGNYSAFDASNTACTLAAMVLGYYGFTINWLMWSVNNVLSAITFGLALATPTGSLTVFVMKVIFMINGFIGWYNFNKISKEEKNN